MFQHVCTFSSEGHGSAAQHRTAHPRSTRDLGPSSDHSAGHVGQHWPLASEGFDTAFVHNVGKQKTSLQNVLGLPPCLPVAPVTAASTLMSGFTQYGQQWPGTSVAVKPPGHFKLPQVMAPHASLIGNLLDPAVWINICVFKSLSKATAHPLLPPLARKLAVFGLVFKSSTCCSSCCS